MIISPGAVALIETFAQIGFGAGNLIPLPIHPGRGAIANTAFIRNQVLCSATSREGSVLRSSISATQTSTKSTVAPVREDWVKLNVSTFP